MRQEDVTGDLVADGVTEHEYAGTSHAGIEQVGEDVGDVDASAVLVWVAHVAIDVGEDAVSAPWRHEQAKRDWKSQPVFWEKVLCGWLTD